MTKILIRALPPILLGVLLGTGLSLWISRPHSLCVVVDLGEEWEVAHQDLRGCPVVEAPRRWIPGVPLRGGRRAEDRALRNPGAVAGGDRDG